MITGRGLPGIFDSLIDRLLCVAGAVLFSQCPEFMQQYLQRLGGHLDEARRQLAIFQQTATQSGLTWDQLINQTGSNSDPAVAKLAGVMTGSAERASSLQLAHDALLQSALLERPYVFVRHLDWEIARATAAVFKPAVPTTGEGLAYAVAGMLFALGIYHLVLKRALRLLRPSPKIASAKA